MIRTARRQKLGMRPAFQYHAPVENENLIRMNDSRETVSNHKHRPAFQQAIHRLLPRRSIGLIGRIASSRIRIG